MVQRARKSALSAYAEMAPAGKEQTPVDPTAHAERTFRSRLARLYRLCTKSRESRYQLSSFKYNYLEVLEAAGVEPASESTPSQASTCVAALECSRPPSKSDGNRRSLAPIGLAAARRNRARRPACFYDIQPRPAGENGVDVAA